MDCVKKINVFGLFATLISNEASLLNNIIVETNLIVDHYPEQTWLLCVLSKEALVSMKQFQTKTNLFGKQTSLVSDNNRTAIYLNINFYYKSLSVDAITALYKLSDLHGVLSDFFGQMSYADRLGQRQSRPDCALPVSTFHIWQNFWI